MRYLDIVKFITEDEFDPFSHLVPVADDIDPAKDCLLSFSQGNNKKLTKLGIVSFSLPAGYTCPFADTCHTLVHRHGKRFSNGRILIDKGDIRCYASSQEATYPNVRNQRWRNFDLLKLFKNDKGDMVDLINRSIAYHEAHFGHIRMLRIHESGDFFSQPYFDAWIEVARENPRILFYGYTKSLPFWSKSKGMIPRNLRLVASEGGKRDDLISKEKFRKAVIVKDKGEAIEKRLHIDLDDFLAAFGDKDFALLIHGGQKAGSEAGKAVMANRKIKEISKKMGHDPAEIARLLKYYTS